MTQALAVNFGGLIQNFALQKALSKLGHDAYTIRRSGKIPLRFTESCNKILLFDTKQKVKRILGRSSALTSKEYMHLRRNCMQFVKDYIKTTDTFRNQTELYKIVKEYNFKGYVVGSDQVWRPRYSQNIYNDFLDFCQEQKDIKRIAYAASFGVDNWEFSEEQTIKCASLAKNFNAISVREDSAISLCHNYLGMEATHVLDPTLLLEKEDYIEVIEKSGEKKLRGELFCYILDTSDEIQYAIKNIERRLSLKSIKAKSSPTKWLRAFMDAKMVFTDSFHGCVFSIIFNKPFWVIGNDKRGNARFDSLLKMFALGNRRISIDEIKSTDLTTPIEWNKVNAIKEELQKSSYEFITSNL